MISPKPKLALITGAVGGIGRALVRVFNEAGYRTVATDLSAPPPDLDCTAYIQANLARYSQEEAYASEIDTALHTVLNGHLDVIIHNAATQITGGIDSLTREDWRTTIDVNLLAPFLLTKALLPELQASKGNVINIGSIHARLTKQNFVAYATSKAALSGMTRALAVDLGSRVRINCIEPAAIETEMLKAGFEGETNLYTQLENCHPQQRVGEPEEVAYLALAIASDAFGFMHGACISLDGGIGGRLFDPN